MVPGIMPHVQPIVPLGDYQNLAARKYPYEYAASKSPKATPTYVSPGEMQLTWTSSV